MIRALIFDCFGVLYSDGRSQIDSNASPEKKQEIQDLYKQSDYGYISRSEFLNQLSELTGLSLSEINQYTEQVYKRNDNLISHIKKLKHHYKIGMLSNVGEDFIESLFTKKERDNVFDEITLSCNVGVLKPSREAYELAAERLGVKPEECLFTDDIAKNVEGAELAGMNAILFTSNQQYIEDLNNFVKQTNA